MYSIGGEGRVGGQPSSASNRVTCRRTDYKHGFPPSSTGRSLGLWVGRAQLRRDAACMPSAAAAEGPSEGRSAEREATPPSPLPHQSSREGSKQGRTGRKEGGYRFLEGERASGPSLWRGGALGKVYFSLRIGTLTRLRSRRHCFRFRIGNPDLRCRAHMTYMRGCVAIIKTNGLMLIRSLLIRRN